MTGREFFSRFPSLYPFLLKHLELVADTADSPTGESKLHPSLFLLLLILSKLYPSPMDGTYSALSMAPFIPFILSQWVSANITGFRPANEGQMEAEENEGAE
ncbi:hypothetical protein GDO86_008964 [Hymenochirus boettgeri]|uniref:tRNA (32-2'-O)-methyltransferase regulator THADA-like C-terminal TPR repeats region domain-containing protein n=1 Tax=Hymenochirus boettgeri TaxID=247094 RepID=A0A8T2JE66_9PIPI|nr:hypothetical protein GDO86_008964 [Hymenochirus boettgeri]